MKTLSGSRAVVYLAGLVALGGVALWLWLRSGAKPVPTPEGTVATLRQLGRAGDWARMAEVLDHAVILVPEGDFLRGSEVTRWDERPQQTVFLDGFEIDQFEVTNIQYQRFVLATGQAGPPHWYGSQFPAGQADYPVAGVTWDKASAYCAWANKRLPTEAEWEKACRGTDGRIYPWGNEWEAGRGNTDPQAGYFTFAQVPSGSGATIWDESWSFVRVTPGAPGDRGLRPVGSYLNGASPYGVLDMAGNVSEWAADWYVNADYSQLPLRNPQTLAPHWNHGLRGSPWYDPNGGPDWVRDQSRCSARNSSHDLLDARLGVRCARSVSGQVSTP